jgi:hypothetical protein
MLSNFIGVVSDGIAYGSLVFLISVGPDKLCFRLDRERRTPFAPEHA